jgi:Right handed beta helix region
VMWYASNNNIVENCNIHHSGRLATVGGGIVVTNTSANNLILNNDVHHNTDTGGGGNSDGIAVTSSGAGNVVRGNRVWRNADDGIDLWNAVPVLVENNWAWQNGYNDSLQPLGNGNGFKLGGAATGDGGHTIRNNLSWRNLSKGFDDNAANVPMFVYNNTAYENGSSNFGFGAAVANVLKNNLSYGPSGVNLNGAVINTFNSWNLAVTVSAADFVSLDFSGATGPRNADGSLPTINFLRLAAGSDLIGKGVNVGIPYTGSAPNLGAYQYGGSLPPPTGLRVVSTLP